MSAADHLSPQFDQANAERFVSEVRATGGASMDVHSGRLVQPGQHGYMVGGESDISGHRIRTGYVPASELDAGRVQRGVQWLRENTTGRHMMLGAWTDSAGNVELDASRSMHKHHALREGRARGEKAIWDNHHMKQIDLS